MVESLDCARRDALQYEFDAHLESEVIMHEMIIQAADNKFFHRLAQLTGDRSTCIRWLVETTGPSEEVLTMIDEHCTILDALQAHDPETTQQRLVAHLQAGMVRTLAALERMKKTRADHQSAKLCGVKDYDDFGSNEADSLCQRV